MVGERFKGVHLLIEDAIQLLLVRWLYHKYNIDQNLFINPRQSNALNLTFSIVDCIYNMASAMA